MHLYFLTTILPIYDFYSNSRHIALSKMLRISFCLIHCDWLDIWNNRLSEMNPHTHAHAHIYTIAFAQQLKKFWMDEHGCIYIFISPSLCARLWVCVSVRARIKLIIQWMCEYMCISSMPVKIANSYIQWILEIIEWRTNNTSRASLTFPFEHLTHIRTYERNEPYVRTHTQSNTNTNNCF